MVEELLYNFFLHARAHGVADYAAGPRILGRGHHLDVEEAGALRETRVLARGRRLDVEAAKALRELRRLRLEVGEAARGMVQESPQRR